MQCLLITQLLTFQLLILQLDNPKKKEESPKNKRETIMKKDDGKKKEEGKVKSQRREGGMMKAMPQPALSSMWKWEGQPETKTVVTMVRLSSGASSDKLCEL